MIKNKIMSNIQTIKTNIRLLAPRPFGEKIGEIVLDNLIPNLSKADNNSHDRKQGKNKVESKFARAITKTNTKNLSFIEQLSSTASFSYVKSKSKEKFDCNIQQVKPKCFDILYYGVIFDDYVYVFKIKSEQLLLDSKNMGYSNKQHRGNIGEGQFHIKSSNLQYHIDNYLYKKLTWTEFVKLLK
jgi:hypothetical protein